MGIVTWTPEKDERLRVLAVNHTHRQIGVILGHTQGAVASRCEALGIRRKSGRAPKFAWTPELDAAIKDADAEQIKRIAPLLNVSADSIHRRQEALKSGAPVFNDLDDFGRVVKRTDASQVKCAPTGPVSVFQWGQR